tara:strand:- start:139 stop:972 length:834 start_codon:yes stop_codon:yes gene_type:complete
MAPQRITTGISDKKRDFYDCRNARAKELREAKRLAGETTGSLREKLVSKLVARALLKVKQKAKQRKRRIEYVNNHKEQEAAAAKKRKDAARVIRKVAPAKTNERGIYAAVAKVAAGAVSHAKAMANQRRRATRIAKENRSRINKRKRERRLTDPHFLSVNRLRCRLANFVRDTGRTKLAKTCELFGCSTRKMTRHLTKQLPRGVKLNDREIDHIFPMSRYHLTTLEDQKRCMHWSNLQPLTRSENSTKKDSLPNKRLARRVRRDCWPIGIAEDDLPD